jgi:hypothetical protein
VILPVSPVGVRKFDSTLTLFFSQRSPWVVNVLHFNRRVLDSLEDFVVFQEELDLVAQVKTVLVLVSRRKKQLLTRSEKNSNLKEESHTVQPEGGLNCAILHNSTEDFTKVGQL